MSDTTGGGAALMGIDWQTFLFLCLADTQKKKKRLPRVKSEEKYLDHESSSPVGELRAFLIKLAAG